MPTIYIANQVHAEVASQASSIGHVVLGYGANAVPYESVQDDVDAVLLRGDRFDARLIKASPRLRVIARHGVGTDNVDISAATQQGVWVTVTPGANSRAVAEHVFALLLAVARRVPHGEARLVGGDWAGAKAATHGFELHRRTLGLVGFGNIARIVTEIAHGFGMSVTVYDPFVPSEDIVAAGCTPASLADLLRASDVVSLHVPLTDETKGLIDAEALATMRPHAVIVNTARASLIDEAALINAIESGRLGGAGLDVIAGEEVDASAPLHHSSLPIGASPHLVVTPHAGGQTDEAFRQAGAQALIAIQQVLSGHEPDHAVNQPNLTSAAVG